MLHIHAGRDSRPVARPGCCGAHRRRHLERRGPDGRGPGHRQEGRLDHRHHRRHRQGRPLQLPGLPPRARRLRDQDPRRRLRPRRQGRRIDRRRQAGDRRPQAQEDEEPRGPAHHRRVDPEHARHAEAEGLAPRLRELPHRRAHRAVDPRRRRVRRTCRSGWGPTPTRASRRGRSCARPSGCSRSAATPATRPSRTAPNSCPRSI